MRLPDSLKGEYTRLEADRSPYLQRARDAAAYTLPVLLPPDGKPGGAKLRRGYSNFGARCVNSLAAKLLLAILPARQSFFRFAIDDKMLDALQAAQGDKAIAEVDKALGKMEQAVQTEIETTPTRTPIGEAVKHLLIAGNALVYMLPKGGVKLYALHSFVCDRDCDGNVLKVVAHDRMALVALPDAVRQVVVNKMKGEGRDDKEVSVYTGVFRQGNHWEVWQEVEGERVPGSDGSYPLDSCPWLPLRWTPDGSSYGRGMVEDYMGYFQSLEGLTAALVKGTAIAAKVVYLRKPNGQVKAKTLSSSNTGDIIDGNPDDVSVLQGEKAQDFRTARELINDLKDELSYAFALNQAIQRTAERVTAEEIRYMAQELDSLLGGIYSTLSLEFQLPYLRRIMLQLQKSGKLPALPQKSIKPVIVTGLDALGRGAELDNLKALVKDVVDLGGIEQAKTYVNFGDLFRRLATARSVKSDGLIKSDEEVAQATQQAQMESLVQTLGPNAVTQLGGLAKQGMAPQGTQ